MSTKLDANQVLKRSFDESSDRLRTDASVSVVLGTVEVIIDQVNDSIKIGDGVDLAQVTALGELNVIASPQPGVDIGDITINNAAGASSVNIQDGGNSITVDANNLDIRDLTFASDKVDVSGSEVALDAASLAALENITVTVSNEVEIKNDSGSPVPISATSLPLPTGAATSALQTQPGVDIGDVTINNAAGASAVNIQDGGNSITIDNSTLSVIGSGTEASAIRVTIANDSTGLVSIDDNGGSLTVDGSVTANAGTNLNTSALNLETTQSVMSGKLSPSSSALSSVSRSNVTQVALASNANRKGFLFFNDTGAICYIAYAATASTASFTYRIAANAVYESSLPCYTGIISVIWGSAGASSLLVTELT